jgi:hypothetical protein
MKVRLADSNQKQFFFAHISKEERLSADRQQLHLAPVPAHASACNVAHASSTRRASAMDVVAKDASLDLDRYDFSRERSAL